MQGKALFFYLILTDGHGHYYHEEGHDSGRHRLIAPGAWKRGEKIFC